jgi:hypothetical protein
MSLHLQIWKRAKGICEYRHMPQELDELDFEIDHVIAQQHDGKTILSSEASA